VNGNLYVTKLAVFTSDVSINGNTRLFNSVSINKDISSAFALDVSGITMLRNNLYVDLDVSFNSKLFVGSDVSFNGKLFVNSDVSINGNVSTGNLFVNGVQITSGGGNLSGNVQVGSNNGFVSIDKPYFYADPSLALYYNFDTSYNNGTQIQNIANPGTYDGSINGTTTGMIDTTTKLFGNASLNNDPNANNNGIGICLNSLPTTFSVNSSMSFSFWVYKPNTPDTSTFDRIFEISDLTTGSNDNNTIALDISSSGIILPVLTYASGSSSCITTISSPILSYNVCNGIWNHIIWNITPSNSYIYINGSLKQTDTINNAVPTTARKSASVGYSINNIGTRNFSGNIDDFRYYNGKALNYAEIYQLYNNNFYTLDICGGFLANGSSVIYETVGSKASANTGSLTLLHGDASGSSSIMFKSVNDPLEYGYIQFEENSGGSTGYHYGLMTLGIENDAGNGSNGDRISLFPSGGQGYVGVNTKTPYASLDVSGQMRIYEGAGTVASASTGSLVLEHAAAGGTSSIVFKASNSSSTADYAYIQYTDNQFIPPTYKWDLTSSSPTFNNSTPYPSTGVYTSPIIFGPTDASFAWALFSSTPGTGKPAYFTTNSSTYCISFNQTNVTESGTSRINYSSATVINSNNFSFSAWISPSIVNIPSNYIIIASASDDIKYAFEIVIAPGGSIQFMFNGKNSNSFKIVSTTTLSANTWYHIACTYNDSTRLANIYINGSPNSSGTITDISSVFGYNKLHIGTRSGVDGTSTTYYGTGDAPSKGFRGYMAFLNFFNTVLTPAEVSTLYNNPNYVSSSDAGLLTIGNENDITYLNNDRISLWPGAGSGFVGVNTKTPLYTLDVSGTLNTNLDALINGINVGKGRANQYANTAFGENALKNNITGAQNTAIGYNTLSSNTSANQNVAIGSNALYKTTTGGSNVAIGISLLENNVSGTNNIAIGTVALRNNISGIQNIAIGNNALNTNISSGNSIAIGTNALSLSTVGNTIAIGTNALEVNTTGTDNTAIGFEALKNNISGMRSIAIGSGALKLNNSSHNIAIGVNALLASNAEYNIAIGNGTLQNNVYGHRNIAIGSSSLVSNIAGNTNVAIGFDTLSSSTGSYNTAVGHQALIKNNGETYNTAVGYQAGYNTVTFTNRGNYNTFLGGNTNCSGTFNNSTAIGYGAIITGNNQVMLGNGICTANAQSFTSTSDSLINSITVGRGVGNNDSNTIFGYLALNVLQSSGVCNTAIGTQALNTSVTIHSDNTAIGFQAGYSGTYSGSQNTFIGRSANISGNYNNSTAVGYSATITASNQVMLGSGNCTAHAQSFTSTSDSLINGLTVGRGGGNNANNVAIGVNALPSNTSGNCNIAVGAGALYLNTIGIQNTAIGFESLRANTSNYNTAVGYKSLTNNIGINNIAVGGNTLVANTNGNYNTAVGYQALDINQSETHNTAIGFQAGSNNVNTPYRGNFNTFLGAGTFTNGNYTNSTAIGYYSIITASNQVMLGSGNCTAHAQSFNATSDYRAKENIMPLNGTFTVDVLNPVTYNFKSTGQKDVGFIAHEVQEFYPFLVTGEKDGSNNQSLNYNGFIGILTKEIKDLKVKVARQEEKISNQEEKALNQDTRIQTLEKMMSGLINK
jgi:hypothetical protein